MRILSTMLVAATVTAAFVAGRVTGPQPLQIASAQSPATPAMAPANPADGMPAQRFSHFKCYQTQVKLPKPALVALRDQFGESRMQLAYADLFCAPVQKKLMSGQEIPLPGPADHLLCYRGEAQPVNQARVVVNQLQKAQIRITAPRYLCVPTWKEHRPGAAG